MTAKKQRGEQWGPALLAQGPSKSSATSQCCHWLETLARLSTVQQSSHQLVAKVFGSTRPSFLLRTGSLDERGKRCWVVTSVHTEKLSLFFSCFCVLLIMLGVTMCAECIDEVSMLFPYVMLFMFCMRHITQDSVSTLFLSMFHVDRMRGTFLV